MGSIGSRVAVLGAGLVVLVTSCIFDVQGLPDPQRCGNGLLEAGEFCDGNDTGGITCGDLIPQSTGSVGCTWDCRAYNTSECTTPGPVCGDGVMEGYEDCDDGNDSNLDDCLDTCILASCGDGWIHGTMEVCEPNDVPSDCLAEGFGGGTLACEPSCQSFDTSGCTTADGAACTLDTDCGGGVCLTESTYGWPGGTCTRTCNLLTPCPSGGSCIQTTSGRFCFQICATGAQCRPAYYCFIDPWEAVDKVCRPRCDSDSDCPVTASCNLWRGVCNTPVEPTAGETGALCNMVESSCKGYCWEGQPGGYCVSPCALSSGFCPGDGICADVGNGAWGDYGYCLDGCSTEADCPRTDDSCIQNPFGPSTVCLPN